MSAVRAELEQHNNTMNASVVDENGCSNSTLFGQRIREVLNPDSDSRIVKDRSSNDQEIQVSYFTYIFCYDKKIILHWYLY